MMRHLFFILLVFFSFRPHAFSQTPYPKITGYVGVMHPIVTFNDQKPNFNFKGHYIVGVPAGINIWKNQRVGFSMEFVPIIRAENGDSKVNNLLFHPGVLMALGRGFTFAGRVAFETSGRYGITPVLNKTIIKNKHSSYFLAVPLPIRFGNSRPASLTVGFQFGIAF